MKKPNSVREPIQVYLDEAERGQLDDIASREGISRSEALRRSVRSYHQQLSADRPPMLQLLSDAAGQEGLMNAPADMARRHDDYLTEAYTYRPPTRKRGRAQ